MPVKKARTRTMYMVTYPLVLFLFLIIPRIGRAQDDGQDEFFVSLDVDLDEDGESGSFKPWKAHLDSNNDNNTPPLAKPSEQVYHVIYDPVILGQPPEEPPEKTIGTEDNLLNDPNEGEVNSTTFLEIHIRHFAPKENKTKGVGLFPVVFNLARNAKITSNATCGGKGPETYCKLVQHVLRRPANRIQCGTCDAWSSDPLEQHPITNAIDGSNSWWQSPSIANGIHYNWVTITLDLGQVFQVAYVIIKAANSPRPGNWILERSIDGINFKPWQFYSMSDSECWNTFGLTPTIGVPRFTSDDEVICTSFFSRLDPLEDGEIHTSLVNGRPGVDGPSKLLQEFTSARYIRLSLLRIRTLNADLMTFMSNDPRDLDPSVTNRYFYSIKDVSVGGQCICYGHARQCPVDLETREMRCECEKNTCGKSCEMCCPMFNQLPWKQGTYTDGGGCEECMCYGHASSCVYNQTVADLRLSLNTYGDYEGGGICQNCQDNTMGINCELCEDGFYRPTGVDHWRRDACIPCDCDTHGATGHCVKDDSHVIKGHCTAEHPRGCAGDCVCKEGFAGPKCSQCAPGWTGYPACEQCACSTEGSENVDPCEGECYCKPNTCGIFCDECKPGYFNLQGSNPNGCDQCFCFDLATECHSLNWRRLHITSLEGWNITNQDGVSMVVHPDSEGHLRVKGEEVRHLDGIWYWAPSWQYTGNRMLVYGGQLEYRFHYRLNKSSTPEQINNNYLGNHDVILMGSGLRIGHNGRYYRDHQDNVVTVNMTEGEWRHMEGSTSEAGSLVLRAEFLMVLAHIDKFLIRATHHLLQTDAKLKSVRLDEAAENGPGPIITGIEICTCPVGYAGTSCELCAEGYRRVDNQLLGGHCVPCQCNGRSNRCDPYTGNCVDCEDHYYGARCEECAPGFYSNTTSAGGIVEGCKRCQCPLGTVDGNFAEGCRPGRAEEGAEFVCYGCHPGYIGNYCERCDIGYYGNPLDVGGSCKQCDCHGNAGRCDEETGRCLVCLHHTEGEKCERCMTGYYGTAHNGDCSPCDCDLYGSRNASCDRVSGLCDCRDRYMGRDCGQCLPGRGNTVAGCPLCDCDYRGSLSTDCDSVSGQCQCQSGVGGIRCDRCQPGYFDYTDAGCQPCGCDVDGTNGTSCDALNGQCHCKPHVAGYLCDHCQDGYWGLREKGECIACLCNVVGSESDSCEKVTGQCRCKPGVGGLSCDECLNGYYGFSLSGCAPCQACLAPGQVCDRVTGGCVCPQNTEGSLCERCTPNSWGHDPILGCQPCQCNSTGATYEDCDAVDGQCVCREGFAGIKCDSCQHGHYGFPHCQPCDCDPAGTLLSACDINGQCQCNENGHCPCKENVAHKKCKYCKRGSFSLEELNPKGCTSCFCFGRTDTCVQIGYTWSKVDMAARQVSVEETSRIVLTPNSKGLMLIPVDASSVHVEDYYKPLALYWGLPKAFLGDKVLAYNGRLRFTAEYDLKDTNVAQPSSFALVQIIGAFRLHLLYMLESPPSDRGYYEVLLREDLWQDTSGKPVSRESFMVALQNIQQMFIFAAPHAHLKETRLEGISLDIAHPSYGSSQTAIGIEKCICPQEYEGTSCQNPGSGYYRQRPNDFVVSEVLLDLVGESIPCQCYGHSLTCEAESGKCLNCVHGTVGDHCELCEDGFYGNATDGTAYDCNKCACPLFIAENNFSPTCYLNGKDYTCDACAEGYAGVHCERCSLGYYGNPQEIGSSCQPCACDPLGSQDPHLCDPVTGACTCREGIWGRACNKCEERYALVNGICTSCDIGCPGVLMKTVDDMEYAISNYNETSLDLWPYRYLVSFQKEVDKLEVKLAHSDVSSLKMALKEVEETQGIARKIKNTHTTIEKSDKAQVEAEEARESAEELAEGISETRSKLQVDIDELNTMINARLRNQSRNSGSLVEDAEKMLEDMIERGDNEDRGVSQILIDEELGDAYEIRDRMKELALRHTNVSGVADKLDATSERLFDLKKETGISGDSSNNANSKNNANRDLLNKLQDRKAASVQEMGKLREILETAHIENEKSSHNLWNVSAQNYKHLACYAEESVIPDKYHGAYREQDCVNARQELTGHRNAVEIKGGLLEQNIPLAKELLQKALGHAEYLEKQADELEDLFAVTRESAADPIRAAKVYENIRDAVKEAEEAAEAASNTADDVIIETDQAEGGALPAQALEMVERSRKLAANATSLETSDLKNRLDKSQRETSAIEYQQKRVRSDLGHIRDEISNITSGVNRAVRVVNYRAENAMEKAMEILDSVEQKTDAIHNDMRPKVDSLQEILDGASLSRANASLQAARQNIKKVVNMTNILGEHLLMLESMKSNITGSIEQLRDNIKLAREQANNIKVSLQTDGKCVRKYQPSIEPSNTNKIVLHFKTDHYEEDMMLLFIGKPDTTDFMALELVDQHVRFSWDMGGGATTVVHPLVIESDDETKDEDKWYKVEVERISRTVKLRVYPAASASSEDPDEVTENSPSKYTQLNLDKHAHLFVGGVSPDYQLPKGMQSQSFRGCLSDVMLDGKSIGLWNFRQLDNEGTCDGCAVFPSGIAEGFQFDGSGFSEMPPLRGYNPRRLTATVSFKTFWEEAQLLFSVNKELGDFASMELQGGQVVFRFSTGNGDVDTREKRETKQRWESVRTMNKYNTNEWTVATVTFSKDEDVVYLKVNDETVQQYLAPDGDKTLDLKDCQFYYGGVHPDIDPEMYGLTETNFLGCMRGVRLASRGSYRQNLLSSTHVGVQDGCQSKTARTTGFHGDGWTEHVSPGLPVSGDVSFSFRTKQEEAMLLLVRGVENNFLSFSLTGGRLAMWFMAGIGISTLTSTDIYNDGFYHSISTIRMNRIVEVYVDETLIGRVELEEGSGVISPRPKGGMYIGGVPTGSDFSSMVASQVPLHGCISNVVMNKGVIALDEPLGFKEADIGRCDESVLFPNLHITPPASTTIIPSFTVTVTLPETNTTQVTTYTTQAPSKYTTAGPFITTPRVPPSACAIEGLYKYYSEAVAFGDILNSHAEIVVKEKEVNRNFNISVEFKTYYDLGLIFYVTNEKQSDFIAVQIAKGQILVSYDDLKVSRTIQSSRIISDGIWHKLVLTKNRKRIILKVDDEQGLNGRITRKVDVIAPLYVGGVPKVYRDLKGVIAESFKGCMRYFTLNHRFVDLINSKAIMGVRRCYKSVENGVHFDSFGYAVYSEEYEIGSEYKMSFDFRTTRWNGVIMSISDGTGQPALALELVKGQLTFRAVNSYGPFAVSSEECPHCLCDNRWHHVEVSYLRNVVAIRVDGGTLHTRVSPGGEEYLNTYHELLIGGVPVFMMPQGATTTGEFFHGCIKNLYINDTEAHWHNMHRLSDVHISACPISE